jgi:phenylalanyl-tRNA synthetase beta chain
MINNPSQALSLSFWGGESCAIDNTTTNTIIELAIYNPTVVRQNSRQLKVVTEAGTRLEKFLDPELIPLAFNQLVKLIIDNCGGSIGSEIFDYYPNPKIQTEIKFDPKLPSIISGINIPESFALDIVKKVGSREDINIEEDLAEEVIRFYGYNKIPTNEPILFKKVTDITPPIINLIEQLKDKLVNDGYDEVITWPLVSEPNDIETAVKTENSINSEVVYLRQSLIPSLQKQLDQYQRFKVPNLKFFEIGKIFSKIKDKYIEKYALGTFDGNEFSETILDDLEKPELYLPSYQNNNAIELTTQITTLDANVNFDINEDPIKLIDKYSKLIDPGILWSMEITDIYQKRYTFRVCYYNCDDKTAKKIHLDTFNLN